jgi:hypothetical protein
MKNFVSKLLLLMLVSLLFFYDSQAQVIQDVQNSFNLYKQSALQEKIFVHTDKDTYLPGELIWFKVYCVDGNDHKPLSLSKIVYVDLLDVNQNPIIQAKVALANGMGNGSIYIPVLVTNGFYRFRAYTSWMKNFGPEFYFEKKITLINPLRTPDVSAKSNSIDYDIQFFPEGGHLVTGITSKVAFKAMNKNGKGVAITGAIVNRHNDTVARFKSLKFGMGTFSFTPAANDSYKAFISVAGDKPLIKYLPEVSNQGYVMKLTDNGSGQLDLAVNCAGVADNDLYLFAHTRQTINAAETAAINNGSAHFSISRNALGEGISHLTIFNSAKQPVCERLYFKRPEKKLFIDATTGQQQYDLRKKVTVSIFTKDKAARPANAEMSMAVYRIDSLQSVDHSDIFNYLWLSSDLKGTIESPEYYFNNTDAEGDAALDNLMLTQGWRRFQWANIIDGRTPAFNFLPEYEGHIITGRIVNTTTNKPATGILTYLGIPGKRVQLYVSKSDSSGNLLYNTKSFYGPNEIIVQTNQLADSTYRIDVSSPFSEQFSKIPLPPFTFNYSALNDLQAHSIGMQVLNIYSSGNLKRFYEPLIDSSAFYGKPNATYKLDDFVRFRTMEEDLREYVKEDNIVKSKGKFHIKVLTHRGFIDGDPLILLDGIPVFDVDKVIAIDPLKVRKLEVMATPYFYGPSEEQGIFSFTTYKGDLGGVELDPRAIVLDYEGIQLQREFYSPMYESASQSASRIPDFRNLLYWSPSISTRGEAAISFYTSDQPGKYIGVIQGITPDGNSGSQYFNFEVK